MGSGNYSKYSFSYSAGDVDFYGNDPLYPKILTSGESNVVAVGTKVATASAALSGSVTASTTALEIQFARPDFAGDVATVSIALEIQKAQIFLDGNGSLVVSAIEILYASSSLSSSGDLSADALEILYADPVSQSGNADLSASGLKVALADPDSPSGSADLTVEAIRIPGINLSVSGSASLSASAFKFAFASIDGSIVLENCDLTATAFKFAFSSADFSGDVTSSATSLKIAYADPVNQSGSGDLSATALEILFTGSITSGAAIVVAVGKEIVYANTRLSGLVSSPFSNVVPGTSLISGEARLVVGATRFSPSIIEDVQVIRTLVVIDGKPLTEHNRKLQTSVVQSFVENKNWNATSSRYYKASSGRKSFSLDWSMLPSSREQTVDLRFGRDKIQEIAADPDIHTLKILNLDSDGVTPYTETEYNVLVKGYSESLVRRDINNDMYLWDCSIQLEEV
jgi:hypothetical protein